MAPTRVILDTDPGVDDVLAMLLAFSALPEELEVLMISVTYGNVEVQNCLRNVVSLFHVLSQEIAWRESHGLTHRFSSLKHRKPIVAVGASEPLDNQMIIADYFHGRDGLGGASATHPQHHPPSDTWSHLFDKPPMETPLTQAVKEATNGKLSRFDLFTPSPLPAHLEILRLLKENPPNTITIIAIGPLTNCAIAAAEDATTFLRVKELLFMGGAVDCPGNITPVAEFNILADPLAAARVLSLTGEVPGCTLPTGLAEQVAYGTSKLEEQKRLSLKLFPLDVTTTHTLSAAQFQSVTAPLKAKGSPLAEWTSAILTPTFQKMIDLHEEGKQHEGEGIDRREGDLSLHDPMCVWFALASERRDEWRMTEGEDIRVETQGQWTRGMCVVDKRGRKMKGDVVAGDLQESKPKVGQEEQSDDEGEAGGDEGGWLNRKRGNRVDRCMSTPGQEKLAEMLLERVFGS